MRANNLLCVLFAVLACGLALAAGAPPPAEAAQTSPAPRERVELLNFLKYKKWFGKSYSGILEGTARAKYYYSRALRAFASALSYKFRRENYYLSVNPMSDHSPAELDMMENHLLGSLMSQGGGGGRDEGDEDATQMLRDSSSSSSNELEDFDDLPEFVPEVDEDLNVELQDLLESHRGDPGYSELEQVLGGDESPTEAADDDNDDGAQVVRLPPRELSLSKLINTGEGAQMTPEAWAKVVGQVPSNNPFYRGIELATHGLKDQQVAVSWKKIAPPKATNPIKQLERILSDMGENIRRTLDPEFARQQDEERRLVAEQEEEARRQREVTKPDEVFIDWRQSNCMFLPRSQGKCGSCYAFAAITMIEFLHCTQTGKLVPMSEQYIVDCGSQFVDGLDGCQGGSPIALPVFVRNFGMHLLPQYPYQEHAGQCPYEPSTDPKYTGYLRTEQFEWNVRVAMEYWPEMLKHGPIMVAMATGRVFMEYGGGVYSGKQCPPRATHAVLIVGHGRVDNREYWLVRNSHGENWGEQGYMRLDKEADCIHPKVGYIFGMIDPAFLGRVKFSENALHKAESLMTKLPQAEQQNQSLDFGQQTA